MTLLAFVTLPDIGRSLEEAFFMFWETLWALVLGFGLSGAVQAFVSREQMQRALGNHGPKAVVRASFFGMVSSSCSYAAAAMAKSLFQKGADFVSAMVFMFASTNLVIELGIVMLILLGWQFMAAEFVGGPIMIVLLAIAGGLFLRGPLIDRVRGAMKTGHSGGHDHAAMTGMSENRQADLERQPWGRKLRSPGGWADAAAYTMADLTMLRREMVIGYVVAGFLAVLVPTGVWNTVFLTGHGPWTTLENVLVGPLIAVVSFVCSIGNVPLAAALWHGGISFGGVIAFVFADLIALPLLLIYRKYYGVRLTAKLFLTFYVAMAVAALLVELLFNALGVVPAVRHGAIVTESLTWNYTTVLNILFLAIFGIQVSMYRNRERLGGGIGYAIDPICGMQVETAHAPASSMHEGHRVWFCSERCRDRYARQRRSLEPGGGDPAPPADVSSNVEAQTMAIDPVCGMDVDPATAAAVRRHGGRNYFFCAEGCAEAFDRDPDRYKDEQPAPAEHQDS